MKIVIEFDVDNDAFRDDLFPYEVNGILQRIKERVAELYPSRPVPAEQVNTVTARVDTTAVLDSNGNMVGVWRLEVEQPF